MERKDFDPDRRESDERDFENEKSGTRPHDWAKDRDFGEGGVEGQTGGSVGRSQYQGGGSSLESQMQDMGFTGGEGQTSGMGQSEAHKGASSGTGSFGNGRYVGIGKIAKSVGMDPRELRTCAETHGIVPDRTERSCEMFTHDHANQIVQACASGYQGSSSRHQVG